MTTSTPPSGVYTPVVVFFHEDETIDTDSTLAHVDRMAAAGVTGLVLQGSNGEAPHLDHHERQTLVRAVRDHLTAQGHTNTTLIVGCGAASVRETLIYITEAHDAGADFALVLPPAYWTAAMTAPVLENFFLEVAAASALPLLIYNFPGVTGGIDITSDSLIRLARASPRIVGCKLTCGNVGKLQRVASAVSGPTFAAFGGKSDFFLPALVAGSRGVVAALANIAPKVHVELLRRYRAGDLPAAQALQATLSHADWALTKVGIAGVKAVVAHYFGYGSGRGRRPLGNSTVGTLSPEILGPIDEVVVLEKSL
ncbi:dihydrodipicolinate synthase family protein [Aspergillus ibericus CBS 121593]|uniref:Putative dihydrodipicolinate synthase n=1 Tax=Aspergillus ibericus CBS 121593 TaxID=1448316 RepID=A0A395H464_9EURO|nr:putative dihydrodipicolinate synthase [Aspergillus ibericus CBS 121593]RAL02672.1 putative dihydrodipicolinate synthase [Aspergillus ibericus CBS 121593]